MIGNQRIVQVSKQNIYRFQQWEEKGRERAEYMSYTHIEESIDGIECSITEAITDINLKAWAVKVAE